MRTSYYMIAITTCVLLLLVFGSIIGSGFNFLFPLMLFGQIMLIVMIVTILKAPVSSKKTFNEYFYEDSPYKRDCPDKD